MVRFRLLCGDFLLPNSAPYLENRKTVCMGYPAMTPKRESRKTPPRGGRKAMWGERHTQPHVFKMVCTPSRGQRNRERVKMSKRTEIDPKFRIWLIEECLAGRMRGREAARRAGVSSTAMRKWISLYKACSICVFKCQENL